VTRRKRSLAKLILILATCIPFACGIENPPEPQEACATDTPDVQIDITSRPYYMGFTRWPPAATAEAITEMYQFIGNHGDLLVHQLDGGVPWVEALDDAPFSSGVMDDWHGAREATPEGHQVFVALTPLDDSRSDLALYWGETDNMALPAPWDTYPLNHDNVKTAYLNYAKRAVEYFQPDYLAIGIEVNVAVNENPTAWEAYKELHQYIYRELKVLHPDLPIFATFTLSHMQGLDGADAAIQSEQIATLMDYCDLLGVSAYPHGWQYWPKGKIDPVPENFFDIALTFGKPIAITETGAPSMNFTALGINYEFTEDYQYQYIDLLLRKAHEHEFVFIVNWTSIDFDKLLEVFPKEAVELGTIWAYTGLQRSDGCPKKAVHLWDAYLALPYTD